MTGYEAYVGFGTHIAQTSDDNRFLLNADGAGGEMEVNINHTSLPAVPDRYSKQPKSTHGKVAYVVYAGKEVGVFYNWYVIISFFVI